MNSEQLREQCAAKLLGSLDRVRRLNAFVGLDGFVDEIVHAVDKRDGAESYQRLRNMTAFSQRVGAAAGRSTNIELVNQLTKLGGNGPIMANALARLDIKVTFVGAVGYPNLHHVFHDFAQRAQVHSICEPGNTNAVEFDDGKLMLTKSAHFSEITWPVIQERFGRENFLRRLYDADLVGFVNWTMVPYMSDVWEAVLQEPAPPPASAPRIIFFDLADPEKRTAQDLRRALELICRFKDRFQVILGLNEKEACEVASVLGLPTEDHSREGLIHLGQQIQKQVPVSNLVIHPVAYALAFTEGQATAVDGPYVEKPLITTGAGDHFNSGYCLGKMLGLDDASSLLAGVTTSGFYVRKAQSPTVEDLAGMMRQWPLAS